MGSESTKEKRKQIAAENKRKAAKRKRERRTDFLYFKLWPGLYKRYSKKPINRRLVLFADNQVSAIPENLKLIYDKMKSLGYECHFVGKMDRPDKSVSEFKKRKAEYKYYERFFKLYARCRCLYLNDSLFMAFACPPREGTNVIQLWNHCGVLKRFANARSSTRIDHKVDVIERHPTHNIYTHVVVPSPALAEYYCRAFNCSSDIISPLGYPKTDFFLNARAVEKNKEHLFRKAQLLKENLNGRKIVLYSPDARHSSSGEAYFQRMLDFFLLKRCLGDKYVFIIKAPLSVSGGFDMSGAYREMANDFIFDVSDKVSIDTAMMAADILVTDYSTCFFEYSLLERPIIFYSYDLQRYAGEDRFFMEYKDFIPGPMVKDTMQLIDAVKSTETGQYDMSRVIEFKNKYMSACDGNSINKIIEGTT